MTNRYLMVSRVGPKSLYRSWLGSPETRNFDVFLSAYDPAFEFPEEEGVFTELRPGKKVAGYGALLKEHRDLWQRYDHIALFDEDLHSSVENLNEMFAICSAYGLKIAQPALTPDSYFSYAAFVAQPAFTLRHVNFIEMMCPVFRRDIMERVEPLFRMGYESGIDLVWCNLVFSGKQDFAVIDRTPVVHTEAVGHNKAANGFVAGRQYEDDIEAVLSRFALPWLPCVPYGAVGLDGTERAGKTDRLISAAKLLTSAIKPPYTGLRLRSILVHLNHVLRREAKNIPIAGPSAKQ